MVYLGAIYLGAFIKEDFILKVFTYLGMGEHSIRVTVFSFVNLTYYFLDCIEITKPCLILLTIASRCVIHITLDPPKRDVPRPSVCIENLRPEMDERGPK